MALGKSFQFDTGAISDEAYIRIERVIFDVNKKAKIEQAPVDGVPVDPLDSDALFCVLAVYFDEDKFLEGFRPQIVEIGGIPFDKKLDLNMHTQAYNGIKLLDSMSGAVNK